MPELLKAALEIVESGRRIFPLKPESKVPAIRSWPEKASLDPDMVRWWWRTQPTANIGLPTGARLAVLDIDTKHGANPNGAYPKTLQASTPTGGRHYYFAVDIEIPNSVGRLARGIDVRGERGYVVAPPSVLPNGIYRWLNDLDPLNLSDDQARTILIPEDLRSSSSSPRRNFVYRDEVPVGQRNDYLTRLAGYLMAQGYNDDEVHERLVAEAAGLGFEPTRERELEKIVKSVRRYH